MPKRKRVPEAAPETPRRSTRQSDNTFLVRSAIPTNVGTARPNAASPKPSGGVQLKTPSRVRFKHLDDPLPALTPERTARRTSGIGAEPEDASDIEDNNELARQIFSEVEDEESSGSDADEVEGEDATSKTLRKVSEKIRGKKTRKRKASPPLELHSLSSFEAYFHQSRKTRQQTSTSTLSSLPQLDHTEYFELLARYPDSHAEGREMLLGHHENQFPQWRFELSQGFSLMLYGYGSKRRLLDAFAAELYTGPGSVVVVNGYIASLTLKEALSTVANAAGLTDRLGATPNDMLETILSHFSSANISRIHLIVHNLDGESLRSERAQTVLSRLVAHPKVSLAASIDHLRAPLLWDAAKTTQYNFLWHDATTFESYTVEIPADDALSLTTGAGRASGTKGVKYVLASLPTNAQSLFRVLVAHQLQAMEDGAGGGAGAGKKTDLSEWGCEYRSLYQKAVAEFICSNDVAFKTLLKEFMDHQMISTKKDGQGTEILWAPFRKEDLESILEDINV